MRCSFLPKKSGNPNLVNPVQIGHPNYGFDILLKPIFPRFFLMFKRLLFDLDFLKIFGTAAGTTYKCTGESLTICKLDGFIYDSY